MFWQFKYFFNFFQDFFVSSITLLQLQLVIFSHKNQQTKKSLKVNNPGQMVDGKGLSDNPGINLMAKHNTQINSKDRAYKTT